MSIRKIKTIIGVIVVFMTATSFTACNNNKERAETATKAETVTQAETTQAANQHSFSSITDSRDGKTYRTVTIGNQTWMAENLNFATSSGSWCHGNNESNCDVYGRLYDWNTARTVCPSGWRLPSNPDWTALINFGGGVATAGRKLKSQSGWAENGNGTDDFGFSALPGGSRWDNHFDGIGLLGYWWTATESDTTNALRWLMGALSADVISGMFDKTDGFSVRCVKN